MGVWPFKSEEEDLRGLFTDAPVSVAELYQDVPPPEDRFSPEILAAQWFSHEIYGEQMPGIAANMLEAGHDTPALRRLAGETEIKSSADAEPLVLSMLRELGCHRLMDQTTANLIFSRQVAREVIAGLRNPWAAGSHIEIVVWGWNRDLATASELKEIFAINDEVDWERRHRRALPDLRGALLDAFARLAKISIP